MKLAQKLYWLIVTVVICCFCFVYFKRSLPLDSKQGDSRQNKAGAQQGAKPLPNKKQVEPTKALDERESQSPSIPDGFSGIELLSKLGTPLSTSSLEVLRKSGDLPELQAATLESGGKIYVLGVNPGGGLVLHLSRDNTLLAFGFASNASQDPTGEERGLLTEFVLSGQPTVSVLDEKFDTVNMQVQTYESKVSPKKHALVYSKGRSRTLVFFDSTRVDMKKLLPASPDTMDPAMLKQLRSLLEPAK